MKGKTCQEFQEWLDCLPFSLPTEEMKQHLAACAECRKLLDSLAPIARALSEIPSPVKLSAKTKSKASPLRLKKKPSGSRTAEPLGD
jgi:predicted anti-sigma-YlaC factor YlaD